MKFLEALKLMKEGKKVKLPSWGGYWRWDADRQTVMMHCKDGEILDIRETQVVEYTLSNVASDEWVLAYEGNTPILGGKATFNFGEAIKYLKRGLKVARKGWNGKGMYVQLNKTRDFEFSELLPFLTIKNVKNSFNTWVPSISDLLAEDWEIVD